MMVYFRMRILLFMFLILLGGVTADNSTNLTSSWLLPMADGMFGGGVAGGHGGPGGPHGPGVPSMGHWMMFRVVLPDTHVDDFIVASLVDGIIMQVEGNGYDVVGASHVLASECPPTLTLTASLVGGMDCPFYHERLVEHHCGLHVVNNLLGSKVYDIESMRSLVMSMDRSSEDHDMDVVGLDELISPYGDYSQDVLMHAITMTLVVQPSHIL